MITKLRYKNIEYPLIFVETVFWGLDLEIPKSLSSEDYTLGNFYSVIHYWQSKYADNEVKVTEIRALLKQEPILKDKGNPCNPQLIAYEFGMVDLHDEYVKKENISKTKYGYRVKINENEKLYVTESYMIDEISQNIEDYYEDEKIGLFSTDILFFQKKRDFNAQRKFELELLEKIKKLICER